MMKPLTPLQKLIAYSSLLLVFLSTVFGLFVIWLYLGRFLQTGAGA